MRLMVVVIVLVVAGTVAIVKLATYDPMADDLLVDISALHTWKPTTEQIRAEISQARSLQEQRQMYGRLFRSRYRSKEIPVNLRADNQGVFYLECAATIPTWDKALIARQAWCEIRDLFGGSPEVLIYESYIGTPSRWVGVARAHSEKPDSPEVVFDTGWHLKRKPRDTDFLSRLPQGG
ncbi:MAG: hypothetical protein HPY54_06960 [Chthonomonadetes bacterium]|nr:hypothetical protein [Chthonomonadetes bacterium]